MTIEPQGGTTTVVPAWIYWLLCSIAAALPVVLASELLPAWLRLLLSACNAAAVVLGFSSQPKRSVDQELKANEARTAAKLRSLPPGAGILSGLALVVLVSAGAGCEGSRQPSRNPGDYAPVVSLSGELAGALCDALGGSEVVCDGIRLAGQVGGVACGWFADEDGVKCLAVEPGEVLELAPEGGGP